MQLWYEERVRFPVENVTVKQAKRITVKPSWCEREVCIPAARERERESASESGYPHIELRRTNVAQVEQLSI